MEEFDAEGYTSLVQEKVLSSSRPLVARPAMSQVQQSSLENQSGSMRSRAYFKEQLPGSTLMQDKEKEYDKMVETLSQIKMVPLVYFVFLITGSTLLLAATGGSTFWFIFILVIVSMVMFRLLKL